MKKINRDVDVLWQFGWQPWRRVPSMTLRSSAFSTTQSLNKNLGLREDYFLLPVGSYSKSLEETLRIRWQKFGSLARPQFLNDHVGKFARTGLP